MLHAAQRTQPGCSGFVLILNRIPFFDSFNGNAMSKKQKEPFSAFFLRLCASSLCSAALLNLSPAIASDWGVNVYGLSYHWDREAAKKYDWNNEFNPGLGVRYQLGSWLKADTFVEGGVYRDSGRNTAVYGAAALLWPLDEAKRFNLGAALTAFNSDTYNKGDPFIAPLPLFALRFDKVVVNLPHFPEVKGFNKVNTTAMYFTFPLH